MDGYRNRGFVSDPRLIPRIKEVLESFCDDLLEPEDVAQHLKNRYPEYGRKKLRDFTRMVEAGMNKIDVNNTSVTSLKDRKRRIMSEKRDVVTVNCESDGSDDDSSRYDQNETTNSANKWLYNMYSKRGSEVISQISESKNKKTSKGAKRIARDSKVVDGPRKSPTFEFTVQKSTIKFENLGGCEAQFLEVCRLCVHLKHPQIHEALGVTPPKGFLLCGPPGCGKTLFAQAVAGELDIPFIKLSSTELVSGVSGESEEMIRLLFEKASESAPCIIILDEIDAIAPKRENAVREMERRMVSQLITCLDDSNTSITPRMKNNLIFADNGDVGSKSKPGAGNKGKYVLVIGTTNRPDSIDSALRRAGRFDKEIALGIPGEKARTEILSIVCRNLRKDESVDMKKLARLTPGYVGADLSALAREASMCAVNRAFETIQPCSSASSRPTPEEIKTELSKTLLWLNSEEHDDINISNLFVTFADFERALTVVHPSAKREGFATVPDVRWEDIGALHEIREELKWSILYPIKRPEDFEILAICSRPQGILLCGPPGCGKTLLAKAVANETGMNFISIKGPELLSMYVGESERAVRTVFQRARDSSPCVIFFDEIDALCPRRTGNETSGSARLVNQLLTEMDGMQDRREVFLIGATNRPDIVDPAILRPGRLDKVLFVDFPSPRDRADILLKATKNRTHPRVSDDVSFDELASSSRLEWFTGADLCALIHEASLIALRARLSNNDPAIDSVGMEHFLKALDKIVPSVSDTDRKKYLRLKEQFLPKQ